VKAEGEAAPPSAAFGALWQALRRADCTTEPADFLRFVTSIDYYP
jgi:hypothetical protein